MDSRQQLGRRLLVSPKKTDLVNVSVPCNEAMARPVVGVDHVAGLHGLLHEGNQALSGHSKRGKVKIRGTVTVANFQGTISRQIGKETFSERVLLRRKLVDPNEPLEGEGI